MWSLQKKQFIRAIIIYPNKHIINKRVSIKKGSFQVKDDTFVIDEKAVYFFGRQSMSIYHSQNPDPLLITKDGFSNSMTPKELTDVIESDAVEKVLSGAEQTFNLAFIINILVLVGVVVLLLAQAGVISLVRG